MALLSGTAAQLALDFLRSGRAFKEGGIDTLQKAYKATNRGEVMPEKAVSEFRKLIKALEVNAIHQRLLSVRTRPNRVRDASGPVPWSAIRMTERYIPKSVNYWADGDLNFDPRVVKEFRQSAEGLDYEAVQSSGKSRASKRAHAAENRTEAAIIEALINLFGGTQ